MLAGVVSLACILATISRAEVVNQAPASTNQPPQKVRRQAPVRRVKHTLSGAELYSMHCNRCHPERYPTERTAAQWKTIMLHMRVRANLPAEHARRILIFLQDNSGR